MVFRRPDMQVDPPPRIKACLLRRLAVVVTVLVMVVAMVMPMLVVMVAGRMAVHVDASVEIAVGLVYHRRADRLLRVGKSHGQRIAALHDLGKADRRHKCKRNRHCGRGKRTATENRGNALHSRFLFNASAAKPSSAATYADAYSNTAQKTTASTGPQP